MPVIGGDAIVELVEDRLKRYHDRNLWYLTLESYYYGPDGAPNGPYIKAMNSQGRPQLRDSEYGASIDRARRFSSRRLSGIADDYAALKGRMPVSRAVPPSPDQGGQEKAERLTKYLYSTYELSHLAMQQPDAGRLLSVAGDAVYVLEPGTEGDAEDRVVWSIMHPAYCYPGFRHGFMRYEMYDLAIVDVWSRDDILMTFGIQVPDNAPEPDRRVTTYLSPYQRTIVVGTDRWKIPKHVEWNLGFCPAQWVFNKPGNQMGQSDIANALDQQDLLDHALNVWADGIVHMTYPLLVVKDANNNGQDAPVTGPGAPPFYVSERGGVDAVTVGGNPQSLEHIINQTVGDMNAATGSSQVRQEGQMHGSIQTGRAIQATQGPQSTRIEAFHEMMASVWKELNAKTLKMQEKAPVLKDWQGSIYGRLKGVDFHDEMSAQDIGGWYRTTVTWESLVGMNPSQKLQIAAEGNQFKLWTRNYAREMVGVEDPLAMEKELDAEMEKELQLQMRLQGQQQAGGQPGGGAPQATPGSNQAGSQPAPMVARPFGMAQQQGPQQPTASGITKQAVEQALAQVKNLSGEVFAIGELAFSGSAQQAVLAITSPRDHRKVTEAVKGLGTVKVQHVAADKMPAEAVKLA